MDVPMGENAIINAQHINVCLDIFQCDDGTFLHHVAQITRQRQFAGFAFAQRCLDEENLTAYAGPCQTGYNTGIALP